MLSTLRWLHLGLWTHFANCWPSRTSTDQPVQRVSVTPLTPRDRVTKHGRGDTVRTCDLMLPKHPLYQAELRPECYANYYLYYR